MLRAGESLQFDDVIVEPAAFRIEKSGRPLALEPKSFRLLLYLIENRPRLISKDELLRNVWEDVVVTDNAVTRVVAQLRKALGDDARVARYIETVPTVGYRFVADVTPVANGHQEVIPAISEAPPVAAPAPVRQPRPTVVIAIATTLATLAGLIAGAQWQRSRTPIPPVWTGSLLGGSIIASHPRISPDGQLLAFRAIVDNQSQVAVMKPDSANWTVLTNDRTRGAVNCIAWSWDGSKLYFDRQWSGGSIYSMGPLGGEPRLVLENAWVPEPLPDGSLIVLRASSEGRQQLLHYWPDSGRLETLPASVYFTDTRTVRAFPDGKEIAVLGFYQADTRAHLFALDLISKKARNLSGPAAPASDNDQAGMHNPQPPTIAVTADGRSVLTQVTRDDSKLVVAVSRDGADLNRVMLSFPEGAAPLVFDPARDGSIFMDQSSFDAKVVIMSAGGRVISETPLPRKANRLVPLPDGKFVYALRRGGRPQLFLATPGSEPRPLLNSSEPSGLPGAWLGQGRLAFVIGDGVQSHLAIGSIDDGRVIHRFPSEAHLVTAVTATADGKLIYYASEGVIWVQRVEGGEPRKIGAGYDVAVDPSGKTLYLMQTSPNGLRLMRMPAEGGTAERIDIPEGYNLTPNRLSPSAAGTGGQLLLPVNPLEVFFYQSAIFDPVTKKIQLVPVPPQTVVSHAGWTPDGNIALQATRWSSTLWRYRQVLYDRPSF